METRKERSKMLRILSEKKRRAFYESQLGQVREVLFEGAEHEGQLHGYTENYVKTSIPYDPERINSREKVRLTGFYQDGTVSVEPVDEPVGSFA